MFLIYINVLVDGHPHLLRLSSVNLRIFLKKKLNLVLQIIALKNHSFLLNIYFSYYRMATYVQ